MSPAVRPRAADNDRLPSPGDFLARHGLDYRTFQRGLIREISVLLIARRELARMAGNPTTINRAVNVIETMIAERQLHLNATPDAASDQLYLQRMATDAVREACGEMIHARDT